MKEKKPYIHLNSFLLKPEHNGIDVSDFLKETAQVNSYELDAQHELEGKLFVKIRAEKKPKWSSFTESLTGNDLSELSNVSSAAVLFIKKRGVTIAFTFGYGRHLIDTQYFVQDFGIKTALNTLNHDSLRSVDTLTLDDQAVQKKSQASREAAVNVFGIDISRDILRAVTGSPRDGVDLWNISGGDSAFSFGMEMDVSDISDVAIQIADYYSKDTYKNDFFWVDNIRKVKEKTLIELLDSELVNSIKAKSPSVVITIPEILQWDDVLGFSFTRSKNLVKPTIESTDYLDNIDPDILSIDSIRRDRVFVLDIHENESEYQLYKCIYFEHKTEEKTHIIFSGVWYEIDNSFMNRIDLILSQVAVSKLNFPEVYTWQEDDKSKIESEGDYNERAAADFDYHLLDKKLIKSNRTTTSIELCDLMTENKQFIHVKHRKGGSAGLSHLFAQGNVCAEILLGDKEFRKAARKVLSRVDRTLLDCVPLNRFKSDGIEIVFLILGESSETLLANLPFFSKVNLSKTYENLSQRGYSVSLAGAGKVARPEAV